MAGERWKPDFDDHCIKYQEFHGETAIAKVQSFTILAEHLFLLWIITIMNLLAAV